MSLSIPTNKHLREMSDEILTVHTQYRYCPWDGYRFREYEMKCPQCGASRTNSSSPTQSPHDTSPGIHSHTTTSTKRTAAWKKNLYDHQPYDDNYVDESFLQGMIKNAHVIPYDYWNVLRDATVLAQQVSTVTVFAILFVYTMWDELPVAFLCAVDAALFLVGYVVWTLIGDDRARTRPLVEAVLLVMLLIGVSPVIRSLTLSYSNDTIWAWSLTLFATHIITQDYSFLSGRSEQPSSSAALSLNAAVFATVLLVSRLESSAHAFAILCLAFELFGLSPIVRRDLKASSPDMHIALTVLLYVMAASLLFPLSTPIAITYLVGLPFIVFGSPAWLILIQKYKSEIIGPWDEAVPSNVSL